MQLNQHRNARTTMTIRKEIQDSSLSVNALAIKYGLSWATVKKWKLANDVTDRSSRPRRINTDLSQKEEDLICFHRRQFKSTIEEIYLTISGQFTSKKIYPMKIYRCLKRYGLNVLPQELKEAERKIKKFRKYGIGYLHIDFIFTRRIDKKRYYVFTCIDRVSKLAYIKLTSSRKAIEAVRFLDEVMGYYPYRINYILTDNGSEFTDTTNRKHPFIKPKNPHAFVKKCYDNNIKLRHTKFKSPWTNGMVERFNRKIKDNVIKIKYFSSAGELAQDLVEYINKYNFKTRLRGLNYKTPIMYTKDKLNITDSMIDKLLQTLTTYRY